MSVIFKRDYNIYISTASNGSENAGNTVQLKVKDFSFNQSANIDKGNRNPMDPTTERTQEPFISIISPVTFSFTTYIKPLVDTNVTSPEEYLWTSLMGNDTITNTPTNSTIDFADGNVGSLQELTLWFNDPNNSDLSYRIDNAIVDSARISFDLNGIAMVDWQGRALSMTRDTTPAASTDRTAVTECVKNKLSTITIQLGGATSYTVALTGGSIDFNNNNQFYGRTRLGKTTTPVGHYTGDRDIKGDLTFYMKHGTNLSADLYNDLLSSVGLDNYETNYYADITINIGGTTAPYVQVNVPRAILNLPRINFEEALTMAVPFEAKEGTGNYSTVIYYA